MSLADSQAPMSQSAQMRFFSRLEAPYGQRVLRTSTWPFRVADNAVHNKTDIHSEAARVIRTTARDWWPVKD